MKQTVHQYLLFLIRTILLPFTSTHSQDSTTANTAFQWQLMADFYYSYDFNNPPGHLKPGFLYNYNRHNLVNVNLALAKVSYSGKRFRSNAGLMAGTYPEANLASEPEIVRNIFEANAGYKLLRKYDLWIDAGIFPSHIGFESAIATDNSTLSRSMAAENSPYYETGIKLTYKSPSQQWLLSGLLLNGWQRIKRNPGNKSISLGTQLSFTPHKHFMVNWSSFWGNDKPDSVRQFRIFHNFYTTISVSDRWSLVLGFDIGWQRKLHSNAYDNWYTPVIVGSYQPGKSWSFAARAEYYHDPRHVIIQTRASGLPFRTAGLSVNADKQINSYCLVRIEYRYFLSKDPVFIKDGIPRKTNTAVNTAIILRKK